MGHKRYESPSEMLAKPANHQAVTSYAMGVRSALANLQISVVDATSCEAVAQPAHHRVVISFAIGVRSALANLQICVVDVDMGRSLR